jgi:hypothetical protein
MNCEGFLIKPIQRLCKYPLLLRELIKNTPEEHPDYRNLINAQKQIEDVVTYVNEGRRSAENQQKIVEIQDSFDVELQLVSPSRRLVREGKLSLFKNGHLQPKQVYLFNDLLLIRRGRSKPLQVPIEELNIINHADQGKPPLLLPLLLLLLLYVASVVLCLCRGGAVSGYGKVLTQTITTETLKNVFELTYKGSGDKVALISFGSEEEKTLWFKEIKKMVEDVQKKDILELRRRANSSAKLVDKTASSNSLTPSPSPSSSPSSPSSSPSTASLSPRTFASPSSPISSTSTSSSSIDKTAATKSTSLSASSSTSSTPTTAHLTNGNSGVEEGGSGIRGVTVDGWLMGHLIYHKLTGKKLFEGSSLTEMVDTLANPHLLRTPPTLSDDLPPPAIELLNYCWQVGPQTGGGGKQLLGLKELMEQVEMVESNSKSKKKKSGRKGMAAAFTQRFLD